MSYVLESIAFGLVWFLVGWLAYKTGEEHRV